jgi:hypothetical protein
MGTIPIADNDRSETAGECGICEGRFTTYDARCICGIKSRIAMAKAAFNRKKTFHQQI